MSRQTTIRHTGQQSPYHALIGLQHYSMQLAGMLATNPDTFAIINAVVAGKAAISPADPADGSVTVQY